MTIETYKDKDATIPHGEFIYYGSDGKINSLGNAYNGKKEGWWYFYTDSFTLWKKEKYEMGKLVTIMDLAAIKAKNEQDKKNMKPEQKEEDSNFRGGDDDWLSIFKKHQLPRPGEKAG